MTRPYTVGILIFGDPTRGGTITSEVKFLATLQEKNEDCEFVILTVNPSITKRVIKERFSSFNFPHRIVTMFDESRFGLLRNIDFLVTYPGHSNFFGGYLNPNVTKMYKIISLCTNELDIPVFIRINDSEIKVRDYKRMCEIRLKGKPESAFMKDPANVKMATDLVEWKTWNYERVFWFANGSREACDWVAETMYDREDPAMRMAERQTFVNNAIYVSDDIFFMIRKNYIDFREYETKRHESDTDSKNKFCYIGFFDTVNTARSKAFNTIFKNNQHKIPIKIFGKGTEILSKLAGNANIEIEEGFIEGNSVDYFNFLNKHLAYIFVGKGQSESRYIGKTAYDAIVARTPIAVYGKCDSKHIMFSNAEFYFDDEKELNLIHKKLTDTNTRDRWIKEQATEILSKLSKTDFKFSDYVRSPNTHKFDEIDFYVHDIVQEEKLESHTSMAETKLVSSSVKTRKLAVALF